MIFYPQEDVMIKDQNGKELRLIKSGMRLEAINVKYLPKDSKIWPFKTDMRSAKEIAERYFIVYIRDRYVAVDKDKCLVPIVEGWKYNI